MEDIEKSIEKYLNDHYIYPTFVEDWGDDQVRIQIDNGDWKHEHLYCTFLMKELGYEDYGEDVTEEDGSDTYSATHTYHKVGR